MLEWREFLSWFALYQIDPWGEHRADLRQTVSLFAVMRDAIPDGMAFPSPVWPYFDAAGETREPDWEELSEQLTETLKLYDPDGQKDDSAAKHPSRHAHRRPQEGIADSED